MHKTFNPEVEGLPKQRIVLGSSSVCQEQKAKAAVGTSLPKLDRQSHENFGVIIYYRKHKSMDPTCFVSTVLMKVCFFVENVFLAHFGPVNTNHYFNATAYLSLFTNYINQFTHLLMALSFPSPDLNLIVNFGMWWNRRLIVWTPS